MKTSNKLVFALLGLIFTVIVIANFALKKEIEDNATKNNNPKTNTLKKEKQLKADTITVDSSVVLK